MMDILSYYLPNQRIICIIHDILVKYQQRIQKFEGVFSKIGRSMHKKYQRHNKILQKIQYTWIEIIFGQITENSIYLDRNYFWTDFVNNRLVFSFHINI